jgi:hypothetical protein
MSTVKTRKKISTPKKVRSKKRFGKKANPGFAKAWEFWKTTQIDLSNFKFDREDANAR